MTSTLTDLVNKQYTITAIPGDGIGPEVMAATKRCVEATGVAIQWEDQYAGVCALEKYGNPLPDETLKSIEKNKIAIKGPTGTPRATGFRSVNVAMRQIFDLFACVRPIQYFEGIPTPIKNPEHVDFVIVRENTEDLYAGIEFAQGTLEAQELIAFIEQKTGKKIRADSAIGIKPISITATDRILRYGFEYAKENGRKKVTVVTKSNIMKDTDGLFLIRGAEIAKEYPDIEYNDLLVDNMNLQITRNPAQFDVVVMPNLYGDILSDGAAAIVGGLGVVPGANIGNNHAIFEAVHGTADDIAGRGIANPTALTLSGVLMLRHLGETAAADNLERSVQYVIKEGKSITGDLKPQNKPVGTQAMADAIIQRMKLY